jgi:hypothetical protein
MLGKVLLASLYWAELYWAGPGNDQENEIDG